MSIPGKVLIALLSSLVVAAVAAFIEPSYSFVGLLVPTAVAAIASVVLSHRALPVPDALATDTRAPEQAADKAQARSGKGSGRGTRERGGQRSQRRDGGREDKRPDKRAEKREDKREDRREGKRDSGAGTGSSTADAAPRGETEEGTVKWFNVTKGYGFIIRGSGEEIFVHHRSVLGDGRGSLDDGARVRFRVAQTDKGPQAEDVEPL